MIRFTIIRNSKNRIEFNISNELKIVPNKHLELFKLGKRWPEMVEFSQIVSKMVAIDQI